MPPVTPVNGLARCRVQMTLDGQQIENVLHFHSDSGESLSYEGLGDALIAFWRTELAPHISSAVVLRQVNVVEVAEPDTVNLVRAAPAGSTGGADANSLPNNCALVVTHYTNRGGRRYRGRTYVPGVPENVSTLSRVTQNYADTITAVFGSLVGPGALAAGWTLAVASSVGSTNGYPTWYELVTQSVVRDTVVDSQRRRSPGRGR